MFNKSFVDFDDVKLCELCRNQDNSAWFLLMTRYYSVILKIAYKYVGNFLELDDLMQEGFLGLLNAVNNFDKNNQPNFKSYARVCITNKIKNYIKLSNSEKVKFFNNSISTENNKYETVADSRLKSPENIFIQKEDYLSLVKSINSDLSDFEKKVLNLYLDGFSYATISNNLNVSVKSINNAMVRIRQKLR
jgi:RNA polymerase sporulation-specific sigma factor